MNSLHSKARVAIFVTAILLLILAFPSPLHARQMESSERVGFTPYQPLAALGHHTKILTENRHRVEQKSLLLDQDIRVRAATTLIGDPMIKRSAENARVPITVLLITAPVILDA